MNFFVLSPGMEYFHITLRSPANELFRSTYLYFGLGNEYVYVY